MMRIRTLRLAEPAPVTTRDKASKATALFKADKLAHEFFDELRQRAEARIEEARTQDEEFGEC